MTLRVWAVFVFGMFLWCAGWGGACGLVGLVVGVVLGCESVECFLR